MWKEFVEREDILSKQISYSQWLTEGDSIISFFHRSTSKLKKRSTITKLLDDQNIKTITINYWLGEDQL